MLEKMPSFIGRALGGIRPGVEKTASHKDFAAVPETIVVESAAFAQDAPMPADVSADGRRRSPPLSWRDVPVGTAEIVLIVEDADSPTPEPLVHAIALGLRGGNDDLPEGALPSDGSPGQGIRMGKNSYGKASFLPADPPPGHGPHRYLFQVFALGKRLDLREEAPGRGAVVAAIGESVLAKGVLIGTYERA